MIIIEVIFQDRSNISVSNLKRMLFPVEASDLNGYTLLELSEHAVNLAKSRFPTYQKYEEIQTFIINTEKLDVINNEEFLSILPDSDKLVGWKAYNKYLGNIGI